MSRVDPFAHILGQRRAIGVLLSSMASERLHHAWIFHGPPGVGKRTVADAFAAALLDPTLRIDDNGATVDEDSETRRLVATGNHSDLHVVVKELAAHSRDDKVRRSKQMTIPVEVLREYLLEPASLAASIRTEAAARKVFIVDEAEIMQAAGQNALLKMLEEPPPGVVIILVTAAESRLLPTIRSRAQRVAFTPLSDDEVGVWIDRAGASTASASAHGRLVAYAGGSPGKLHLALETGIAEWHDALETMLAESERGAFSGDLGSTMKKLTDDWAVKWEKEHKGASKDAANKAAARYLFDLLAERFRASLRAALAHDNDDAAQDALARIDLVADAERNIHSNVNAQIAFDNLAAQLPRGAGAPFPA